MAGPSEVIGLREANAALRRLPELARAETQQVMDVTAFQVAALATRLAPDREPVARHGIHLKDAITWKRRRFGAVVAVDRRAFHWKFFEYGTKFMPARPMFRPAAVAFRDDHRRRLENALTRANTAMAAQAPIPHV
jgi:HK97 gp10 family phage protein